MIVKFRNFNTLALAASAAAASIALGAIGLSQWNRATAEQQAQSSTPGPVVRSGVTALGRLEPESEVVRLAAPLALDGDRVSELRVREGDQVRAGQVVALLASETVLAAEYNEANRQVQVAEARLAQVKAGAKTGDINSQRATVNRVQAEWQGNTDAQRAQLSRLRAQWQGQLAQQSAAVRRLEAELANAQSEYRRYEALYQEGAESASRYDSKRLSVETLFRQLQEARAELNRLDRTGRQEVQEATAVLSRVERAGQQQWQEAKSTLSSVAEVRTVDVRTALAEVAAARAARDRAAAALERAYLRAPSDGQILKIHARAGEKIGDSGLLDLAQTDRMVAVAEVYQTDVGLVRVGQPATIVGQAVQGSLRGTVTQVGLQVLQQNVFSNQPGENLDRRVVEVRILLDPASTARVRSLTNLQVEVSIETGTGNAR
ncbi:HlyD family efflux transporter periplasmic adaptor subunit [Limnothrix sp. PR1529]|uniref:HlyD family efflux transporter periplasmic adaptor subunit n=1 Tax=Limnothrix sp. PR1529 TaxID=1704291 RepID=UPI000AF62531|nr:HlyD family efflux transporter periplasmic adaptor subunit [Limnothrix sp. PR1529]